MKTPTINSDQDIHQIRKMNDSETILKELEELDDHVLFYEAKKQIELTKP